MPGKGAKAKGGPKPVGGAAGRQRPNRFLLAVLGVAALAAVGRLAMPSLFGGGGKSSVTFTSPVSGRTFVAHLTPTTVAGSTTATTVGRPSRNPFSPPAGYGSS